jgi:hypothetical protein
MGDLISRKAVMKAIEKSMVDNPHTEGKVSVNHFYEHQHFMSMVIKQPTAYDVDKVIERLDSHSEISLDLGVSVIKLTDAIGIVRGGGKGE